MLPPWHSGWLIQSLPVCSVAGIVAHQEGVSFSNYTFTFTVPPWVGTSSKLYALRPQILLADGTPYGPSGVSNAFQLDQHY
jgi:hypothetical protein